MTPPEVEPIFCRLYGVLLERKTADPDYSYVAQLFKEGRDRILQKVGEEAVETLLAAKNQDRQKIIHETADLWFHTLVMLADQDIHPEHIFAELERRVGLPAKLAPLSDLDRREYSRHAYQKNVTLQLRNGLVIEGLVQDISPTGMLVACSYEPKWQLLGETGLFEWQVGSRINSFSFEICRITNGCLGLNITSDRGLFSLTLTKEVGIEM